MPPQSALLTATKAVQRLLNDKKSYRKELEEQKERVKKLEEKLQSGATDDDNAEYLVKQEKTAIKQTEAVFPQLDTQIDLAVQRLQEQIAVREGENEDKGAAADQDEELKKASEALQLGLAEAQAST